MSAVNIKEDNDLNDNLDDIPLFLKRSLVDSAGSPDYGSGRPALEPQGSSETPSDRLLGIPLLQDLRNQSEIFVGDPEQDYIPWESSVIDRSKWSETGISWLWNTDTKRCDKISHRRRWNFEETRWEYRDVEVDSLFGKIESEHSVSPYFQGFQAFDDDIFLKSSHEELIKLCPFKGEPSKESTDWWCGYFQAARSFWMKTSFEFVTEHETSTEVTI